MTLTALEQAREQPGILIEIQGTISAAVAANLLQANNRAFRAWCRANGQAPRDLVIVDSGTGSYWARLKDAAEVASILELGKDILPPFITHLATIVHLGLASAPEEFRPLFVELLKSYRKAIATKAVTAVVISGLATKSIEFKSANQIDQIVASAATNPLSKSPKMNAALGSGGVGWKPLIAKRGIGFKRHGVVRVLNGKVYVQLDGMDGTLLPAHGQSVNLLINGQNYAFKGHTLTNNAEETIGYAIERAESTTGGTNLVVRH